MGFPITLMLFFFTEDASLQLLENVTGSIAGVDNVKSEELTSEEVIMELDCGLDCVLGISWLGDLY